MIQNITPVVNHLKMRQIGPEGKEEPIPLGENEAGNKASFGDLITKAINSVDQAQDVANQDVKNIIMGKSDNIAETMIAMEKAQLSFQLMLQIRNKVVNTYKELSRMTL